MSKIDTNELRLSEEPADELLTRMGYTALTPAAVDDERDSPSEPLLVKRLEAALRRLNPWLSPENVQKAVRHIGVGLAALGLAEANERAYTALVHNLSVEQDLGAGKQGQTVRFIDFENPDRNDFAFVRQYRVSGAKTDVIADIAIFVNGIPLAVIECKSPTIAHPVSEGIEQLLRYQEVGEQYRGRGAPRLFMTAQMLVSTCGEAARYATVGTPTRFWAEWKDSYPLSRQDISTLLAREPKPQDILLAGLFHKENLLDLVRNFTVFEVEKGHTIKKVARYHQFVAVNKALYRITHNKGPKRGGVVWHTQGSGKSLTMQFLAVKLRRLAQMENPLIVIVTDRTDLDTQIASTFMRCGFPSPKHAQSVKDLRALLSDGHGKTMMTTVQKFQEQSDEKHPVLSRADNVFVMVDEAHRTQYSGLGANMRHALPNACFIAFTGTPIDKKNRSTFSTFGDYIHTYTIEQAVLDGATVPIYYEMRQSLDRVEGKPLDTLFREAFEELPLAEQERLKQRYGNVEAIAAAPRRVERICEDLLQHFRDSIRPNGFKAQVVACSRDAAVVYKETLDRMGAPESAIIISSSNNDSAHLARWHLSPGEQKRLVERFKDKEDPLAILVVCDMLLTGFDAPVEQVMYLDSPLREHTLLQAIARVNRTADGKDYGLVVDYWGVADQLEQALEVFTREDVAGVMRPKSDVLPILEARHRSAMRFFNRIDRKDTEACLRVIEPEDVRAEFNLAVRRFAQSMDMLLPDPKALDYLPDLEWLGQIRAMARVRFGDEQMDLRGFQAKVRELIEAHINTEAVEQLLKPVNILSGALKEELAKLKSDEARASAMEHALRREIHVRMDENPVVFAELSERLESLIEERRDARIDAAQQLQLMLGVADQLRNLQGTAASLGLDETGYAVYRLLEKPDGGKADGEGAAQARRELAKTLMADLKPLLVVDWAQKEDVKKRMRAALKTRLRESGYARPDAESLTLQVMDIAQARLGR
ncbi:type I restriction endonuclease subunit R [Archangium lansingense]|uniref:type I restriction endonuclease subunit R n=1 Tax=Archangium lansingense TaxID=2995310 RepID=UPI003B7C1F9B